MIWINKSAIVRSNSIQLLSIDYHLDISFSHCFYSLFWCFCYLYSVVKDKKFHINPFKKQFENPFVKAVCDKKRIREAIRNGEDPTKIKDIKFVPYVRSRS